MGCLYVTFCLTSIGQIPGLPESRPPTAGVLAVRNLVHHDQQQSRELHDDGGPGPQCGWQYVPLMCHRPSNGGARQPSHADPDRELRGGQHVRSGKHRVLRGNYQDEHPHQGEVPLSLPVPAGRNPPS